MTIIYVAVVDGGYEGESVIGAYSTQEKAQEGVRTLHDYYGGTEIDLKWDDWIDPFPAHHEASKRPKILKGYGVMNFIVYAYTLDQYAY